MNWYFEVLKKYFDFSGRARRKEYWMFTLFNIIAIVILLIIGMLIAHGRGVALVWLYELAVLLPSLGVAVRRLHDTGRSGWWILISLVPLVGGIILFVFTVLDSVPDNQYGPNPKGATA
ncbi:MAG TPA: DUF805 domain-containing protein [Rhodanobacteraceae bacterium]